LTRIETALASLRIHLDPKIRVRVRVRSSLGIHLDPEICNRIFRRAACAAAVAAATDTPPNTARIVNDDGGWHYC